MLNYIQLIDTQAKMKMKAQANKLLLSYIWWLLEPLLLIGMFYFVFGYVLNRGGGDFFNFLMIGKIVFSWFSKSVVTASTSLPHNKGIIGQKAIPKWVFPMVNIQEAMYKSCFSFFIMFVLVLAQGYSITTEWVKLIPLTITLYLMICSVGMAFSILVALAKDFSNIISLFMMCLMFGSGIFWDVNSLSDPFMRDILMKFNPLIEIIDMYRTILLNKGTVNLLSLMTIFFVAIIMITINLYIMNRFNNKLTRFLLS